MLVLSIKTEHTNFEVHMLNPKEHFPGFGGSRHPLVVGKNASMVVRSVSNVSGVQIDTEYDIHDASIWTWIANLINRNDEVVSAEAPEGRMIV